eukprot:Hpha_TRINITY_DN15187_c2_g1::TRINITY_DN15187_c2_g1_i1::g.129396::m.129396
MCPYGGDVAAAALPRCKIVIVGDAGAGKTALVRRFTGDTREHALLPTVGVSISEFKTQTKSGTEMCVQVWDTAGQERFSPPQLRREWYKGASCVVVVCDGVSPLGLKAASRSVAETRSMTKAPVIILANKQDLAQFRGSMFLEPRQWPGSTLSVPNGAPRSVRPLVVCPSEGKAGWCVEGCGGGVMLRSAAEPGAVLTALPTPGTSHMQLVVAPAVPRPLMGKPDVSCTQHWRFDMFGEDEGLFSLAPVQSDEDAEARRMCAFSGGAVLSSPEELPTLSFRVVPVFNASGTPGKQWKELGEELGVPVQRVSAETGEGVDDALASIVEIANEAWVLHRPPSMRARAQTSRQSMVFSSPGSRSSRGSMIASDVSSGAPLLQTVKGKLGTFLSRLRKSDR